MPVSQLPIINLPLVLTSTMSPVHGVGTLFGMIGFPATNAWPAANQAKYVPFYVDQPMLVLKLWIVTGTTGSTGTVDVGIYDSSGTSGSPGARLVSAGSTAQSAASLTQEFDIADTRLSQGVYWLAMSASSTSAHYHAQSGSLYYGESVGLLQEAAAHPLPTTATPVAITSAYIPVIGVAFRTLVA